MRRHVLTVGMALGAITTAGAVSAAPAQASCLGDFTSGAPHNLYVAPPLPVTINKLVITVDGGAVVPFVLGVGLVPVLIAVSEASYAVSGGQVFVHCVAG